MALRKVAPRLFRRVDEEAEFERLYERHVEGVYRYSLAMLSDAADAEDVTQTTFLNAYRAFKKGTRPEKPNSWLIAIAHNVCRQRFRQAQRRPREVAFDEGIGEAEVFESTAPTAEELRRALSDLPPNQRAALVMRELEGSSYAEIAAVLGVSVSALEALLFRARRALREQLEEHISCEEAGLAINRQLDGRLSLGERRALRAHLRACADCNSRAQSQRAQRRALKSLVLVPLPLTIAHWSGAQSASAATGAGGLAAVGAATGGAGAGVGASSIALGGLAAKAAAVVAAGVVVGGGTYEGVKHVSPTGAPPKTNAAVAQAKHHGLPIASARTFEIPKVSAPVQQPIISAPSRAKRAAVVRHATQENAPNSGNAAPKRAAHTPPGQKVKAIAKTDPHALRVDPPGHEVSAAQPSKGSKSAAHSEASAHSQAATAKSRPPKTKAGAPAHAKASGRSQAPTHSQGATHKTAATATETTPTETTETTEPRGKSGKASPPASPGNSASAPRGKP